MLWYFIGINFFSFLIYGLDKYYAIKNKYRVSEYQLLILAIFGGSIGALLGMKVFHHKTKKILFWIINILFTILWIIIFIDL